MNEELEKVLENASILLGLAGDLDTTEDRQHVMVASAAHSLLVIAHVLYRWRNAP